MLRLAFHLALRQAEGLMASIFVLLDVPLSAPDHSTLSRRARTMGSITKGCVLPDGPIHLLIDSTGLKVFGAGEWLQEKHGVKARRTWKRLHLAVDADTGMIMGSTLTGNDVGDPSQVAPLLDQIDATIASVTADGASDGTPTYDVVAGHGDDVRVIIPPHVSAVLSAEVRCCMDRAEIGYSWRYSRKAAHSMPNKHNSPRRHHIPKMKFRVKNWAEYDAGLRGRDRQRHCRRRL